MSKPSTQRFGAGRSPWLRSPGLARGVVALCCLLGSLVLASGATAAEIVEVRVGRHPEFTRVVFELDRAAGYRIERSETAAELVVSVEAASIPRRIESGKALIEQVRVEPSGPRSVARVRLAKPGLRLKEMILANPPRIVLDVLSDEKPKPAVAKAAKPKPAPKAEPKPAPKTAASSYQEESFDDVVAKLPTDAGSAAKSAPAAKPEPKPTAKPAVVAKAEPEPVKPAPREAEPGKPEPVPAKPGSDTTIPPDAKSMARAGLSDDPAAGDDAGDDREGGDGAAGAMAAAGEPSTSAPVEPAPIKPAPAGTRTPRPMVVRREPATEKGSGWMTWALAGGGALVLLVGGGLVARRFMGGRKSVDYSDGSAIDFGEDGAADPDAETNPFGSLSEDDPQMSLGDVSGALSDEEKESESVVFGDSEEKNMDDMEVISREQVNESLGGGMPPVAGVPEEFQQMMREMNRRVEALEGRIDELVDARDRLERQVAAQTEELRVQRAAIARTQRAVRNLARPEDGEGAVEQEATEPALRDPNQ